MQSGVRYWEKAIAKASKLPTMIVTVCNLFFLILSTGYKSSQIGLKNKSGVSICSGKHERKYGRPEDQSALEYC